MEQAVNQFNKGLLMDTHPMVLGNDVLSDCLNGTLITMNSNEVVLQNDMGNAKIDNAYLPPGYLPVGMKEYGGIIYVAAYNPITNKSLIGSFPSPERKISVEDKDLGNTIDLDTNFRSNKLEGINFLDNDILLIPLTSDTSLHAGDKFTVYSKYIWNKKNDITNFDNIILYQLYKDFLGKGNTYEDKIKNLKEQLNNTILDSDKEKINHNIRIYLKLSEGKNLCYSPKNKKYTLSLGILNSLNEFVDITKSLVRWKDIDGERPIKKENESDSAYEERFKTYREAIKPIEFTNESDLIKFNTGYFIAKDFVDPLEEYAGNDKKLIAERLKMAVNSYAYKLIGPLYLKAELNHIKNFDFSIEGTKIPSSTNNEAEVLIRATITYNCPDGINTISKVGDNNYFDYFQGELKNESAFPGFHLYKKSGETYEREYTTTETEELLDENNNITIVIKDLYDKYHNTPETKYNPETNLYEVTIEKKYTIKSTSDNKYEYYICVPSGYKSKDGDDVYIKGLSTKGEIDFNKLGSGTLEINEWRFYNTMPTENNEGNTLLSYEFNVYPRIGHTFSDLEIKLGCSLIGLLIDKNDISELTSIDEKAAATWFLKTYQDNGVIITPSNYTELIDKVNTLWINIDRDLNVINNVPTIPQFFEDNNVIEKIKNHVENGGNLYLTKFASHLIKKLNRTNINTYCRCSYNNITSNIIDNIITYNYPKLYAVSGSEEIYNNMIVSYDKQSNKYCEFIESGYGLLKCRYYVFNGTSADDYTFLGKMIYVDLSILTGLYPSIIEFLPKELKNLDQKGSIIVDGSIYLWTGNLNVLKHNVETLTKNTINYLNSKKNKMLNNIQQLTGEFLSHKGNINISWKGLNPRTLYDVLITYKEKDENDLYILENGSDKVFTINNEWILTTELFNNCYSIDSLDFVDDYARFNNLGENLPNGLKYLVNKLLTVKLDINENIKYTSEESSDYSGFKKLISKNSSSENVESSVINKYKFNFILNKPSINISNEILYPAYINNEIISDFLGEISFDKSIDVDSIQKNIYEHQSGTVSPFVNIVRNEQSIPEGPLPFNFGGNIINVFDFTTYITQKIALKLTSKSINIENCFSSFDTVFSENNNDFSPYCCFGARCPGDCGGKSPKIQMYLILYSTLDHIANENIENSNQNLLLFEMDCHRDDKIDVYNFSTYFDRISEFFNKNHENSQFIVGITNYHEAHGNESINAANTLNDYNGNHGDSGNNIFIVWIRTNNGWIPFHIEDVTLNNNINFKEKIKSSKYYNKNLKYFHTNFKSSPQSINLYTIDLDESYHYISPYNFSFPIKYTIKATTKNDIIIKIGSNLKFKILKENTLDNNISIKYKSNLNFDDTIKLAIQASLGEGLYSYDIDLDTMEDSEHNILRPEVNYIKIDNKLVKDFEEANNIKVFSENDGIKIFSFPNKTIDSSLTNQTTYPGLIQTQYAAHAKADGEGLSVIGLKFDIGAKKFVTNGV